MTALISDGVPAVGRRIAETYRLDPDPAVRAHCYKWLILNDGDRSGDRLADGLGDPDRRVRATCAVFARGAEVWNDRTWAAVRELLRTCDRGHVFEHAAHAAVLRGGAAIADEIHAVVMARGDGWSEYAARALVLVPDERYRAIYAAAASSDEPDRARLGERGLLTLDGSSTDDIAALGLTTAEFHERWRPSRSEQNAATLVTWEDAIRDLRERRVVVLGELHADIAGRATQIVMLHEILAAGDDVILVCERGVVDLQEPVIAAARQRAVPVAFLETEATAFSLPAADRDEAARREFARMLAESPDARFLVCYGENHRRSLHDVARTAGVSCASVCLFPRDDMLRTLLEFTDGRIAGAGLRWPDDGYFLTLSTPGSILGCPQLDTALAAARPDPSR